MKASDSRALAAYVDSFRSVSLDGTQEKIVATCASDFSPSSLERMVQLLTEETFQNREPGLPKARLCSTTTKAPCASRRRPKSACWMEHHCANGSPTWFGACLVGELRSLGDLDALPLIRLQEITRRLGMAKVWRAHQNLRALHNVSELGSRHRLSLRVRNALHSLTLLSIRADRIPQLRILSDCLEGNSAEFLDVALGRLQALVGEADSSKSLIAAARETRARLAEDIFEGSLHVTPEIPRFLRGLMFPSIKMEDVKVRVVEFLDAAEAGHACQHRLLRAVHKLESFLAQVESDWAQVQHSAASVTRVLDPITHVRLSNLLLTSGREALHCAKCEGNEVQRLVEQAARTVGELSAVIVELIRTIPSGACGRLSVAELEARYTTYLHSRNRLLGRIQQAAHKLNRLSLLALDARDRHVTREIDLLVDLVEHSDSYAAALRVRAVVASIKGLARLAQRALCRLICDEMRLPGTQH